MKRVYYTSGPATLNAGIAGRFNQGKAKPVSDKIAAMLLGKPGFKEAATDTPLDDTVDIATLETAALAADKIDQEAAKAKATKEAKEAKPGKDLKDGASEKTEVITHA